MIELDAIGIQSIVANQAICAKGPYVSLHVGGIQVAVAVLAGIRIKAREIFAMAVGAGKGSSIGSLPVACQRIAGGLVGKAQWVDHCQSGICAPVFGMAGLTGELGLLGQQRTMEAGSILKFSGYLDVTDQAALRHAATVHWSGVTGRAFTIYLRVGTHAVSGNLATPFTERARTKKATAPENQEQNDNQQRDPGTRYAARGKATQSPSHSTYLNSVA